MTTFNENDELYLLVVHGPDTETFAAIGTSETPDSSNLHTWGVDDEEVDQEVVLVAIRLTDFKDKQAVIVINEKTINLEEIKPLPEAWAHYNEEYPPA